MFVSLRVVLARWLLEQPATFSFTYGTLPRELGMQRITLWSLLRHYVHTGAIRKISGSRGRGHKSVYEITSYDVLRTVTTVVPEKAIGVQVPLRVPSGVHRHAAPIPGKPVPIPVQYPGLSRNFALTTGFHLTPAGLLGAFQAVVRSRWVQDTENAFQQFLAIVARARRCARDVARFVAGMIRKSLWGYITLQDEDAGRRLIPAVAAPVLPVVAEVVSSLRFEVVAPPPAPVPARVLPSPREVLQALARGQSPGQVARTHRMSLDELRSLLESVRKTRESSGTSRGAD